MSYSARTSGILTGAPLRGYRRRRNVVRGGFLTHMPDVHITDSTAVRQLVWDYDPEWEFEYSQRELHLMAEKILLMDEKPFNEEPYWLSMGQIRNRQRREIQTANGTPDPAIASGLYWRTHPEGRKANMDAEKRKPNRDAFYR